MREPRWIAGVRALLTDARVWAALFAAFGLGGFTGSATADAGVTAAQADSIARMADAPQVEKLDRAIEKQNRMDTAMMRIYFRQDVQMTEDEKRRADSLMKAALKNINYGGSH
jgi:hypothetical protein